MYPQYTSNYIYSSSNFIWSYLGSESAQDYYPFGMQIPSCTSNSDKYRFGFNGQEKDDEVSGSGNTNTALFWEYDTRLGRRWNLDPKPFPSFSNYISFANNPTLFTDLLGDTTYNFNIKTRKYIGMTDLKTEGSVGALIGSNNKVMFNFSFVDPVHDPEEIRSGAIKEYFFVTYDMVDKDIRRSGAEDKKNQGMIKGSKYLKNNSNILQNSGNTDFTFTSNIVDGIYKNGIKGLPGSKLYITVVDGKIIAQNNYNFGNFMWGAAAHALGVPSLIARLGAHWNNLKNDSDNSGKPWYKRSLDSHDDQQSIIYGFKEWEYVRNNKRK